MISIQAIIIVDPQPITKKQERQSTWKTVVYAKIDNDFHLYYQWFLRTKYGLVLDDPIRGAHLTIVNDKISLQTQMRLHELKKRFHKTVVTIEYNPLDLRCDGVSWWINCKCNEMDLIRGEYGLGPYFYQPHITIGRTKNQEHELKTAEYLIRCIKNA